MGKRTAIVHKDATRVNIVYEDTKTNKGFFVLACPFIDCADELKVVILLDGEKYMTEEQAIELATKD